MGRKKYAAIAACFAFLLAIGGGVWWWIFVKPGVVVERQVLVFLNDPDSAKFKEVQFFPTTGAGCGQVNARNKMGGYTGFTTFVALPDGSVKFGPGQAASTTDLNLLQEHIQKLQNLIAVAKENCPGY